MDKYEKKHLRERIGKHLDVSKTRLTDDEAAFLGEFIDSYDDYRGESCTERSQYTGWCSDGKFTRNEITTYIFMDEPGIQVNYSYNDDDGQQGESTSEIKDARGILNWFKDHTNQNVCNYPLEGII